MIERIEAIFKRQSEATVTHIANMLKKKIFTVDEIKGMISGSFLLCRNEVVSSIKDTEDKQPEPTSFIADIKAFVERGDLGRIPFDEFVIQFAEIVNKHKADREK